MGRILGIDYGTKRVGLAISDPEKIIANNIGTKHSTEIIDFISDYITIDKIEIEGIVVGQPKRLNNTPSDAMKHIELFIKQLSKHFPQIPVKLIDERFTSKLAFQVMIDSGLKKKSRQNKELIDSISATIILQNYLDSINK